MTKEVRYDIYCKYCEHFAMSASSDPCNECLGEPSNGDSHVPVLFHKVKPLVNFLNEDPNVVGYTRDQAKSKNWKGIEPPTDNELRLYFEIRETNGDYYEKELINNENH